MLNLNFADNQLNAFEISIMESNQRANEIIDTLEGAIDEGIDPNDVYIDYSDVNESDMAMIKAEVEAYALRASLYRN